MLPLGRLQHQHNGKYHKWYHSNGHTRTYIPKSNNELIQQLALKEYLNQVSADLSNEQLALKQYLFQHNSNLNHAEQWLLDNPQYKEYISSYLSPDIDELSQWVNAPYERNHKNPEHLIIKTKHGYSVRSKSEYIIDMILHDYNIPFRYECALLLGDLTIYPDFTILHPKTRQIYYWEHFGKMQDPKYARNALIKLETYARNNIYPTINLITTYETNTNTLDPNLVENIIQFYFL